MCVSQYECCPWPVSWSVKILKSPSIGYFLSSSVAFFNARAGGVADMQFNFILVNAIAKGESVIFTLPDFSGQNISNLDLSETQKGFNFTVSWRNKTKTLTFTLLHSVAGNTLVYLTLPASRRSGGLGSRPKTMYGERLGDGVEYHSMKPTPRR